jgi:hypothetical protein
MSRKILSLILSLLGYKGKIDMTTKVNNYKILKLRSGSDVIAKITGGDKNTLVINKPMEMKVASFISADGLDKKNILCMKDWLEYTDTKNEITIPKDWVAVFMNPDEDVIKLYEMEKARMADGPDEPRRIDLQEKILQEELENENKDDIINDDIDPNSVVITFAIPPSMFLAMMANGLLRPPSPEGNVNGGAEYTSEMLESLFGEINEEIIQGMEESENGENNLEYDDNDLPDGCKWQDWSEDPNDYL